MNKYIEMGKANVRDFAEKLKNELIETKKENGIDIVVEKYISTVDLYNTIEDLLQKMDKL